MATHTPGPWQSFADDQGHDIIAEDGAHIARVEPVNSLCPAEEQDANGNLLAAAPDLLAAIKAALPDLQHYVATHGPGPDARLAAVVTAIAKAEGKE